MRTTSWNRWGLALALAALGCGTTVIVVPTPDSGAPPATDAPVTADATATADVPATTDAPVPADAARDAAPAGDGGAAERFSFFVTSLRALQELSGSAQGFGGDLRYGETGPGAGLRGADRICAAIAERSLPGAGRKPWRAFLSATDGGDGNVVNAIDRVGEGPWYDRLGRLFANNRTELFGFRPTTTDPAIRNDFPNEDGVPNHRPDPTAGQVDNHDTLTGSNAQGRLYSRTATCLDWTSARGDRATEGRPRVGHSWPRNAGGGRPGGGGTTGNVDGYGHWISSLDEAGCAPGVSLIEMGGPILSMPTVGSGGGYGGFYCFSLTP